MRFTVLLVLASVFVDANASAACLLGDYSVPAEYLRSDAVLIGRVLSEHAVPDPEDPQSFAATIYSIRIEESFRGSHRGTIELYSENTSGRFPMDKGQKYLLFVYRQQGRLSADYCGNSGLLAEKAEVITHVRQFAKQHDRAQKPNRTAEPDAQKATRGSP